MVLSLPVRVALTKTLDGGLCPTDPTRYQWSVDTSLVLMAAGGIMGWRSAWSLMLGSIVNFGFLAPYGYGIHAFATIGSAPIAR